MGQCERIVEVDDWEHQADEFPEGHHKGHSQRGTLCGQDEHALDADVPGAAG